jgi:NitT/TauT family transport system substrate-binding protein
MKIKKIIAIRNRSTMHNGRSSRNRGRLALLLAAAALALLCAQAAPGLELTILVPQSTASTPFFLMAAEPSLFQDNKGNGEHEGNELDIDIEIFINHPQALGRLYRGEVQLLFTGTSAGWESRLDGGPIRMVNTGVWGVSYLMAKDPGLNRFTDLRGKTLALPFPGAPLDFQTRYILTRAGIDPDTGVEIRYAPFTQTVALLMRGEVDAAPLPEPLATSVVTGRGLHRGTGYAEAWERITGSPYSPQVSLFATTEYASEHAPALMRLLDIWEQATQFARNNPARAAALSSAYLPFSPAIIEEAITNTLYDLPALGENRRRVIEYFDRVRTFAAGASRPDKRESEDQPKLERGFFFLPGD